MSRRRNRPHAATYRSVARRHHRYQCVGCGSTNRLEVHHRDKNPWNNDPRNLEWRCHYCHLEVHGRKAKQPRPKRHRRRRKLRGCGCLIRPSLWIGITLILLVIALA